MAKKKKQSKRSENRYAHLQEPEAELDYHGRGVLRGQDIRKLAIDFLEASRRSGKRRVRIITGRGRNSVQGPVVKPAVKRILTELEREGVVRNFRTANFNAGGDGAFDVELS